MSLLAEIDPSTVKSEIGAGAPGPTGLRFAEVLSRLRGRPKS